MRLEYENDASPDLLNSTPSTPDASQLCRLANADLVESPNRRPNPPTTLFKYPTPNIPPTSLTSYRGCVLEMEWKRGFTRVSTCTSSLLLSFSFCPLLLVHSFYSIFSSLSTLFISCEFYNSTTGGKVVMRDKADVQTIYLPPPTLRRTAFSSPPQDAVDYRAVCFCHGEVVDIGFVCSVCLSSKSSTFLPVYLVVRARESSAA